MGDAPDGLIDYRHYRHDRSKFASEYGFLAPPVRATLEDALPQNELSVGSPSWQFHANKFETGIPVGGAPSVFRQALEHRFGRSPDSLDLDTFIALTQSWQAEAYRYSLSHFRRRKFLTSGTLFWMYDDCWVATSGWTIIDSSLRRKPSYYAVRRVYAPEMLSFAEDDAGLSLWLVNDHLQAVGGELEYGFGSFSEQTTTLLGRASYVVPANRSHHLLAFPLSDVSEEQKADRFYWARWLRDGELLSWQHHWLAPWKDISLADPGLEWQLTPGSEDEHFLEIGTKGYAWMVEIAPGDLLDPEDNFFDLTPGQSRTLRIYAPRSALDQLTVTPWNHFLLPRPGSR
jgi:beta-mannosidase